MYSRDVCLYRNIYLCSLFVVAHFIFVSFTFRLVFLFFFCCFFFLYCLLLILFLPLMFLFFCCPLFFFVEYEYENNARFQTHVVP